MKRLLSEWFYNLLHHAFRLMPIDRKLLVFESQGDFSDNAWALYDYMRKLGHYRFAWLVANRDHFINYKDTQFLGWNRLIERIKIVKCMETAAFCFYTHGSCCNYRRRKDQKIINLWHGTPIKACKGGCVNSHYFDYCIVPGISSVIDMTARFLSAPTTKMLPLGCPRNDLLVQNLKQGIENPFYPVESKAAKLIIWMPTFRASVLSDLSEDTLDNETGLPLLHTNEMIVSFNEFLKSVGVAFLVKIHRLQADKRIFKSTFSHIKFIQDQELAEKDMQLYQVVGKSDALLTDYSSVFFDYLLVDKPEGFIVDDIEQYKKARGFLCDNIEQILPGLHIKNVAGLKDFVRDIKEGKDAFAEKRRKLRDSILVAMDGSACANICKEFDLI